MDDDGEVVEPSNEDGEDSDAEGIEVELGEVEVEDPNQGKELEGLEQEDEAVLEGVWLYRDSIVAVCCSLLIWGVTMFIIMEYF